MYFTAGKYKTIFIFPMLLLLQKFLLLLLFLMHLSETQSDRVRKKGGQEGRKGRERGRGREKEIDLSTIGSLPKWPKWSGLSQVKVRNLEFHHISQMVAGS